MITDLKANAVCVVRDDYASALSFHEDEIAIGSNIQYKVSIWNFKRNEAKLIDTFLGHTDQIVCVAFNKNVVVASSWNNAVRMWDRRDKTISRHLWTGSGVICYNLKLDPPIIYTSGRSMIQILQIDTGFWTATLSKETDFPRKEIPWYFQVLLNDKYIAGRQNHRVSFRFLI